MMKVGEGDVIGGGKKKQEITVSDTSGNVKVTRWEGNIGKLALAHVTSLTNLLFRIHESKASVLATKW